MPRTGRKRERSLHRTDTQALKTPEGVCTEKGKSTALARQLVRRTETSATCPKGAQEL